MELSDSGGNFPAPRGFYEPALGRPPAPLRPPRARRFPPLPPPLLFLPRLLRSLLVCPSARLSLCACLCLSLVFGSPRPPSTPGCSSSLSWSGSDSLWLAVCLSVSLWVSGSIARPVCSSAICQGLLLSLFLHLTVTPFPGGWPLCFSLNHHLVTASASLCIRGVCVWPLWPLHPPTPKPFPSSQLPFPHHSEACGCAVMTSPLQPSLLRLSPNVCLREGQRKERKPRLRRGGSVVDRMGSGPTGQC